MRLPPAFDNLPIIPHENVADVDCCACLMIRVRKGQADILCNECGAGILSGSIVYSDTAGGSLGPIRQAAAHEVYIKNRPKRDAEINAAGSDWDLVRRIQRRYYDYMPRVGVKELLRHIDYVAWRVGPDHVGSSERHLRGTGAGARLGELQERSR